MWNPLQRGNRFSQTATHATAAVATEDAATGKVHYITDVSVSSDKAGAILLVKQGTTTIWQVQVGASFYEHQFLSPLTGIEGALVSVEIDGTTTCKANMSGFTQ